MTQHWSLPGSLPARLLAIVLTVGALTLTGVPAAHADSADASIDSAYGDLSKSYNKYFETLMNSPDKGRSTTNALSTEILAPAQASLGHSLYDNTRESFAKAGIGSSSSALGSKDIAGMKAVPEVGSRTPIAGFESRDPNHNSDKTLKTAEMEAVSPDMAGPYAPGYKPSADAVVVDGSQFARELTFPGKAKAPAAASGRAPASVPISR